MMTTNLLRDGIEAVRAGRRADARAALLSLLEADDRNEEAWLWLSGVMDTPDEQRICLENVLAINPQNQTARRGLEWLRQQYPQMSQALGAAPPQDAPPQAAPAPAELPPLADGPEPAPMLGELAAQDPCPFCGAATRVADRRCRSCGKDLTARGGPPEERSGALKMLVFLWGLNSLSALAGGTLALIMLSRAGLGFVDTGVSVPRPLLTAAFVGVFIVVSFMVTVALSLWQRRPWAYLVNCAFAALSLLSTILLLYYALTGAYAGEAALADARGEGGFFRLELILNGLLAINYLAATVGAYGDFFGRRVRLVTADAGGAPGADPYNAGIAYRDRGMWYMAAREWERAVAQSPRDVTVRRALGLAYAQLRRFDEATAALRAAIELGDSPQLRDDLRLVEGLAAKARRR